MYCVIQFGEHLYDDPLEELGVIELPEQVGNKTTFDELEVCSLV